jgi:hypothetical protein
MITVVKVDTSVSKIERLEALVREINTLDHQLRHDPEGAVYVYLRDDADQEVTIGNLEVVVT